MLNCLLTPPGYPTVSTQTGWPSPRSHLGQPFLCRIVRCSNEPRRISATGGRSVARRRRRLRASFCFIIYNETRILPKVQNIFIEKCPNSRCRHSCRHSTGEVYRRARRPIGIGYDITGPLLVAAAENILDERSLDGPMPGHPAALGAERTGGQHSAEIAR